MSNVLSYAQLMSGQNSLEAIKEGARLICDRRGRYADTISNDVERIKSEISVIESLIKTIEANSSVLDSNQESELKSLCEQLKKSLKAYLQKAQSLCTRFNNKKIKVLAFGSKSQGKSTFTRLYTGLPESVVAEKYDLSVAKYVKKEIIEEIIDIDKVNEEISHTVEEVSLLRAEVDDIVRMIKEGINNE